MKIREFELGKTRPFILAEIGLAHEGSLLLALEMANRACRAGVDGVKFQYHLAEHESTWDESFRTGTEVAFPQDRSRTAYWDRTSFRPDEWKVIADQIHRNGKAFVISCFSREAMTRLNDHNVSVDAWKVASGEVLYFPYDLIGDIPVLISTGMSTWKEIDIILAKKETHGNHYVDGANTVLMHCTSMYPTPFSMVGMNNLKELKRYINMPHPGYSDHLRSLSGVTLASALGASIIELHVGWGWGPDAQVTRSFEELNQFTQTNWEMHQILRSPTNKDVMATDLRYTRERFIQSFFFIHIFLISIA